MSNYEFVKSLVQDDVKKVRELEVGACKVEVWQEINAMPPQKITLVIDSEGNIIQPKVNDEELKKAIESLALETADTDKFLDIFRDLSPQRRNVIDKIEYSYQRKIADIWHKPKLIDNNLVFFVDNKSQGLLEKFFIRDLRFVDIDVCAKTTGILLK